MRDVVTDGTGKSANSNMVEIAGTTGTAEVAGKGSYLEGKWVVLLLDFAVQNPKYAMIVVIGEPTKGKYYGAAGTAPVFRKIVEENFEINTNEEKHL
jgi:cell division protein FtsI (penicillin-binding protein 3)/stage V sporulation protein D (sporulation-specific penicillin-binding protein)